MKILYCAKCNGMRSFGVDETGDGPHPWTYCDCKQMAARWENPDLGTVQVLAMVPARTFIIGMNNRFLRGAVMLSAGAHADDNRNWRALHDEAAKAPGFVFDSSNRDCWAAIMRVGDTNDISWHPGQERVKAGEAIADVLFESVKIKVNTKEVEWKRRMLTYKDIVELAGHDSTKETLYTISVYVKGKEGFCLSPDQTAIAVEGMIINCMYTSNA